MKSSAKSVKKAVCFLLVMSITLVLSACSSSIKETQLFKTFDILEEDTFAFETAMDIDGMEISLVAYRSENNFYFDFVGLETLISEGREFRLDHNNKIARYQEISQEEIDELVTLMVKEIHAPILDLNGAKLLGTGKELFMGKELSYEEFRDASGEVSRAFFDGEKLVGVKRPHVDANGSMVEWPITISREIPAGVFDIPNDYQLERGFLPED
ncbi:MAG: hypothetical protein FWG83_03945 [Oscillospiraceae bacterium]|nr:hypothetical protein [Oscillospiraceae bacterium]